MKALTIHEPFAWAIAAGHKPIENRTWETEHRGPLAIHASKQKPDDEDIDFVVDEAFGAWELGDISEAKWKEHRARVVAALHPGCVLAVVMVEGMLNSPASLPIAKHGWWCGPFAWLFDSDVRRLEVPIPVKGMQGLWNLDPHTEAIVREAIS